MRLNPTLDRRTMIIGGLSAPLIGCQPGGDQGSSGYQLPPWVADFSLVLSLVAIAAPGTGVLLGAIGLTRAAGFMGRMGIDFNRASNLVERIEFLFELRNALFLQPDQSSGARPFLPPSSTQQASYQTPPNADINNFDIVPVFGPNVDLQLGVLNDGRADFGDYDLYATVKRVEDPPPTTYSAIWGNGDLPHVVVTPPARENFKHVVSMPVPPNGAYVSYSWKVPRGQRPSDEFVANNAFIGPAFLAVDEYSYANSAQDDLIAGKNLEARFQLPSAELLG